jgi:methanogenic corrinoid protein MtbC1
VRRWWVAPEERAQELIEGLYDGVVNMDEEAVARLSRAVLEEGIDVYEVIAKGLTAAMDRVGELYRSQEYFVPELLLCSDAFYAGLSILKPHIRVKEADVEHEMIIGVVEGDIHDIGKNLVKVMFEAAGWVVYDLGRDVKLDRFVEEQKKRKADVVAVSALMTTSMLAIPRVIEMVRGCDPDVAIMVGGAPLTREIAMSYGADGYADNAGEAVREAVHMLDRRAR